MRPRVLAIGLHGFGSYYIDPLLEQGRLPNLRRFLAESTSRPLRTVLPISGAAWVTILTGRSPGGHGVLDYVQVEPVSYHGTRAELAPIEEYWDATIFAELSRQGRRVASLYWPMTYPPSPVNGVVVSGTPLPDESRTPTWPPELAATLDPFSERSMMSLRYEDKESVERYLAQIVGSVRDNTIRFWRQGDFDFVATCFAAPDIAHHYFWTRDDPAAMERIGKTYDRVDRALGDLVAAAPDADVVALFSDHGGGAAPSRMFSISRWLADEGYLALRAPGLSTPAARLANRLVRLGRRYRLNDTLRSWIRGRVREAVMSVTHNDLFADWSRSRAYGIAFFFPTVGIEINLRGRQKQGIVEPGDEYETLRREIRARLAELVDPATGERVCRRVCLREEMFHGPYLERFPDVVAELDHDVDPRVQLHDRVVSPNELTWEYPYMGYHAEQGILAVRGPGVAATRIAEPAEMIDLAPTLLALAGAEIPAGMEGRPLLGG